jgi:hypothetical protein
MRASTENAEPESSIEETLISFDGVMARGPVHSRGRQNHATILIAADSLQGIPKRQFLQSVTQLTQLFPNVP